MCVSAKTGCWGHGTDVVMARVSGIESHSKAQK